MLKIGTRESELAMWQARLVANLLKDNGIESELVLIKSEGDIDLTTPLYAIGVQGIFTKTLDAALLSGRIDLAVHSAKDVPVQLAKGLTKAAVLKRANDKDIIVPRDKSLSKESFETILTERTNNPFVIATSSIRRKAQWLNRYSNDKIENLRGNVNTRLKKLEQSNWTGAIFAAAGLERIGLRPDNSIELDWMLPAPAQGAIMVVCRKGDGSVREILYALNDEATDICTTVEKDFLKALMGGCSTPIAAFASIRGEVLQFKGNILPPDGTEKYEIEQSFDLEDYRQAGTLAANEILDKGAGKLAEKIRNVGKEI